MHRPLFLFLTALGVGSPALADTTATQDVTITTASMASIEVSGDDSVTLIDTTETSFGSETMSYAHNGTAMKITVESDKTPAQPLEVAASGMSCGGTHGTWWTVVASTTFDLVTAIPAGSGTCFLNLNILPDASVPAGTETVTLTYTITN